MKKPKLLLLDADAVIHCYEIGIWDALKAKYSVHVTSIVASIEVTYAYTASGRREIDLENDPEVTIVEASGPEMAAISNLFVPAFSRGLDDGELEGITVLQRGDLDCRFCSGDTNGVEAVGMLGLSDRFISLEEVCTSAGVKPAIGCNLKPHFTKQSVELHLCVGRERRISGLYFTKPPLS